jgi:hypothetical protein
MQVSPGRQATSKTLMALVAAIASIAAWSCGSARAPATERLTVAFSIDGGIVVDTVSFAVTSSAGDTLASGTVDTHDTAGTVSIAMGIPASVGDTANLSAIARDGTLCAGASPPFEVRIGLPVVVQVILVCQRAQSPATAGSVVIKATVVAGNNCPLLTSWTVSPLRVSTFGAITAAVAATDDDSQDHLTFSWASTNGGFFTAPNGPLTLYSCPNIAGIMSDALTVLVSDNHAPTPCLAGVSVPVTCVAFGDAGTD